MNKITKKLISGSLAFLVLAGTLISCSKDDDDAPIITPPVPIDPLGGYVSSDSVAAANLITYFSFDGNANDSKGNQTATPVRVSYTTGMRGQAWQGGDSVYATVPASVALRNIPSFTYSVWYKLPAQPTTTPSNPAGVFFLEGTTSQNLLLFDIEPYEPLALDSVRIKFGFNDIASPAYEGFFMQAFDTNAINKWVHLVASYNGATSTYIIYQNGVPIGNQSAFSNGGYISPTQLYTDGTATVPLGNLGFESDIPTRIVLGTWPAGLFGVSPSLGSNGDFLGQMDEMRIFNKPLTSAEVIGLYLNGKAGR